MLVVSKSYGPLFMPYGNSTLVHWWTEAASVSDIEIDGSIFPSF